MLSSVRALLALVVVITLVLAIGPIISAPPEVATGAETQVQSGVPEFSIPASGDVVVAEGGFLLGVPGLVNNSGVNQTETTIPFGAATVFPPVVEQPTATTLLMASAAATPTTAATQVAAATAAGVLRSSTSADRRSPTLLAGATVKGTIYVYLDIPATGVRSVAFWLDDPNRAYRPIQTEANPPYDMVGGTVTRAQALVSGRLQAGAHLVTAIVTYTSGATSKVEATFNVGNATSVPVNTTTTTRPAAPQATTTTRPAPQATTTTTAAAVTTTTAAGVPGNGLRITPGQSIQSAVDKNPDGTVFIIAAGTHTNQSIVAKNRNQFIGEPGAILDGGGGTDYAFGGGGDGVVIQGLVIQNYSADVTTGVIRVANGSTDWTVRNNEIRNNDGMGIKLGSGWRVIGNNIHHNQQYGIGGGGSNVLVEGNEIAYNNPNMEVDPYHGAGGTKFLSSNNLTIRNNYSHHNNGPGLWVDGDAINVLYEGNRVESNLHAGIKHEVACRATIRNNIVTGNGFGNPNWLAGAGIAILNSSDVTVTGNTVTNNADGIGGIQGDRGSGGGDNCRHELRNLTVSGNTITMQEGYTGVVTNQTSDVFGSWNNRFSGNTFSLGSQGDYFQWNGDKFNLQEWQGLGMG